MSSELVAVLMFGAMIALLLTGRQIAFIIGSVATISVLALWGPGAISTLYFSTFGIYNWTIVISIPCFVFMGLVLSRSGIANRFYQALYLWMGRLKGGLAMGTVGLCSLVAAMSGLNIAATVTAGTIALPEMLKRKYDKKLAAGTVLAGGSLGFLIPPSVIFIVYGLIAKVSIGHLWLAGILPGAVLAGLYITYIGIRCRAQPSLGPPSDAQVTLREKLDALRGGIAPLILIFLVLGLLFMGITTLLECAAIGALGALAIAVINRSMTRAILKEISDEVLKVTAMAMWIFMAAIAFAAVYDGLGAIHAIERILNTLSTGPMMTIFIMQLSFFLLGMVLDDAAMLLIVAPLYIPIVRELGFSLVWFGVLFVVNMQMAFLTPPYGFNLFILKGILPKDSGITMGDLYKAIIPFIIVQAICLGIIMAFPQIALFIPNLVFGN